MKKLLMVSLPLFIASPLFAAEDYLTEGARHLTSGNYQKAVRSYELAVKTDRDAAQAYKGLGLAYYKMGNFEVAYDVEMISAAVNAFNRSLAIKKDPEVCYFLGLSYLVLYDKKNAETAYLCLKSADSNLAGALAERISSYVKPARFNYTHTTAPEGDSTSVVIEGNRVLVPPFPIATIRCRRRSCSTPVHPSRSSVNGSPDCWAWREGILIRRR